MNGSIPHKGNPDYDHYDPLEVLYMTVIVIINSLHGSQGQSKRVFTGTLTALNSVYCSTQVLPGSGRSMGKLITW